jgi:hypothetical protein
MQIARQGRVSTNPTQNVPKMMDLAVLYGPGSSSLTGQLLEALLLQPKYAQVS